MLNKILWCIRLKQELCSTCNRLMCWRTHTVPKIWKNIPRYETARPPSFYIHVSVSDLYIPMIGPRILLYCICWPIVGIYTVNFLQIHECRNWERGRTVSYLGIFVLEFSIQCRTYGQKCGRNFDTKRRSAETTNLFILVTDLSRL
jgi:hypothetical protein